MLKGVIMWLVNRVRNACVWVAYNYLRFSYVLGCTERLAFRRLIVIYLA